jgi:hypothetical protein
VHPDFHDQPNGKPNAGNRRSQNLQFCHQRIKSFAMMLATNSRILSLHIVRVAQ